jgi:hypothetical protein
MNWGLCGVSRMRRLSSTWGEIMGDVKQQVVNIVVQWALQLERPTGQNRVNRKLLFGDAETSSAVAAALQAHSDAGCAFVVRSSTDFDAVRLRNERPAGIGTDMAIIYLVFWLPGHAGHERNFESLRDFPAVALEDVLAHADTFVLAEESRILSQCTEAALAWPDKERARATEHLSMAWAALRTCLRERRGGRDRSIPFVEKLSDYVAYLNDATVPEELWQQTTPIKRAATMLEHWGRALPRLWMFTLPALASAIGVQVDPLLSIPSAKKSGETKWVDTLEEILAENKDTATDFAGLEENITGKQTLRERLDDLAAKIRLCQPEEGRAAARLALEQFCQSGDELALRQVEWLFRQNPGDRRSPSQGLKGLLIARKLRQPREDPLDRAARETTALIERLAGGEVVESGVVRQYVEERKAHTVQNRSEGAVMANVMHALASGTSPSSLVPGALAPIFDRVLASPELNAQDFERLARLWDNFGRTDTNAPLVADSVLLGLLKLSYARLREQTPTDDRYRLAKDNEQAGELILATAVEGERVTLRIKTDNWSEESRTDIHRWLLHKVRPLYFEDNSTEAEDQSEAITLDVEWSRTGETTAFGVIEIPMPGRRADLVGSSRKGALVSVRRECRVDSGRLLSELFEGNDAMEYAEDPRNDQLQSAWTAYVRALGDDLGWGTIACIAPVPAAAKGWVNAWGDALSSGSAQAQIGEELRDIDERIEREDTDTKKLFQRRRELIKLQQAGPQVDVHSIRSLLRLCTGRADWEGQVEQVVLSPHHPLVVRLRLVGDSILANTLQQLWTVGWDRRTLDDLEGAMDEWGLPEPIHCYGFWDGLPLVFDGWIDEGFALFSALGAGRQADTQSIGVRQVAREIERYGSLFPAAADRLRLRLYGDPGGRWAWRVLAERLDSRTFAADVELVTQLPSRQPTVIEQEAQSDELRSRAFEPGVDGALPRVRIMRADTGANTTAEVHVSAVVGDLIEQFRSVVAPRAPELDPATYDRFDPRVFFHEVVPDLSDYSFLVGDPPDDLSHAVAKAVGFASAAPNLVFRERYAFDPEKCRFPLQQLQSKAHWLVLAAREPLYRAVQQCGTSTLLDFYSATERGRRVHVCVSLDKQNSKHDVGRLRQMISALTGVEVDSLETDAILASARKLAPGLAIRCIGSTGGIDLSGLLGLLLSARLMESKEPEGLLLALDQHRDLLAGGGQLSDLLRIRLIGNDIHIDVIEAKFSTGVIHPQSASVTEAEHQIHSTIQRLEQFTLDHPLILRTRSRLARAIVHRIHLGASAASANKSGHLVSAVLNPGVRIVIGERESSSVHAWSLDGATQQVTTALSKGGSLHIYSRDTTLESLRRVS